MTPRRIELLVHFSRWSVVVLLALAAGAAGSSCRKELPRPPDGPFPSGGAGGGNTGGTSGLGGSTPMGGTSGGGGSAPADMISTDTTQTDAGPCGMPGQACCPGNECKMNGCCEMGTCTQVGSTCRTGDEVGSCFNGRCGGRCGPSSPPNPAADACCEMRTCTAAFSVCNGDGRGACVSCGGPGQICCANSYCRPGTSCLAITGMCVPPGS